MWENLVGQEEKQIKEKDQKKKIKKQNPKPNDKKQKQKQKTPQRPQPESKFKIKKEHKYTYDSGDEVCHTLVRFCFILGIKDVKPQADKGRRPDRLRESRLPSAEGTMQCGRLTLVVTRWSLEKTNSWYFFLLIECWNLSLDIFQKHHISIRHNVLSPIDSGRSGPDDFRRARMYHLK